MPTNYSRDAPVILPADVMTGSPKAPITMIQFGDYECEHTLRIYRMIKVMLDLYPGMVRFNFRHFPQLAIHQRAHKAAEAAIAAAQVGKFTEMHELLLRNRPNLGVASLCSYARELGIGGIKFLDAMVTGRYGQYVQTDLADGLRLGIASVPAVLINGERIKDRLTLGTIRDRIDHLSRQLRPRRSAKIHH